MKERLLAWAELGKVRLAGMVSISAIMGYITEGGSSAGKGVALFVGGLITTWGNIAINQYLERREDALMRRTEKRPLPLHIISPGMALVAGISALMVGLAVLALVEPVVSLLAILSTIMYLAGYTPVKKISPLAVVIGAFPGALPPLIGATAHTGDVIALKGLLMAGMQYAWQLPHFWAIALLFASDYSRAGFRILPAEIPYHKINMVVVSASLVLVLVMSFLPLYVLAFYPIFGLVAAVPCLAEAILFWRFFQERKEHHLRILLGTIYLHLLLYQGAFLLTYR